MDWEDYNYPPCLRILHYNLGDVEDEDSRGAVGWAHWSYIGVFGTLALNLLVNLVLALGGSQRRAWTRRSRSSTA